MLAFLSVRFACRARSCVCARAGARGRGGCSLSSKAPSSRLSGFSVPLLMPAEGRLSVWEERGAGY
jgi:hypothetical protein